MRRTHVVEVCEGLYPKWDPMLEQGKSRRRNSRDEVLWTDHNPHSPALLRGGRRWQKS